LIFIRNRTIFIKFKCVMRKITSFTQETNSHHHYYFFISLCFLSWMKKKVIKNVYTVYIIWTLINGQVSLSRQPTNQTDRQRDSILCEWPLTLSSFLVNSNYDQHTFRLLLTSFPQKSSLMNISACKIVSVCWQVTMISVYSDWLEIPIW